ncbi:MAG: diguanylate cyclase, partial [Burkholderiales bacterium]
MKRFRFLMRRHMSPLAGDTASMLDLPPVKMGLLAKLNLLTIGLIFLTAVAITVFYANQRWRDDDNELRARGRALAGVMTELTEYGLVSRDKAALDRLLDGIGADPDVAFMSILDGDQRPLVTRRFTPTMARTALPDLPKVPPPRKRGEVRTLDSDIDDRRYLEFVAPVWPAAEDAAPIGYVRLGLTYETQRRQFREQMLGAIGVVSMLVVIAVVATLMLTRRLVAPMRRLMRAARAVGSGRLDVYVPAGSSDEMGLLTHTFNHMTQRLAESQSEVASYQRTLEEKVAQRTRELEIATAQAYKLAQHDILTGLPNRSLLNQRLKQILAQAQRDGTRVACLFLDFDHFKRINDTLGHDAGDQLLQAIAQRLTSAVRESDTVARLGGDEFVVILPGLAEEPFEVMTVLARVREAFQAPFRLADQTPTLTCSIGVALYPNDARDGVGLIKQADTAMYAAKDAGRNAYRFYTADMNAKVQLRLQLETDMRRGLMDDEFFLVYQPQIEMQTGRACGVEALLRWRDPER